MILNSLTADKRIHRCLKVFSEKLTAFIDFVREQGPEFIDKLGAPAFKGSLLFDDSKETKIDKYSEYRS